jgi:pimeloyl-ACP methyl ester carboxylesterase
LPSRDADWFVAHINGARKIVYPGIGHLPMEEAPELSARDTDQFLRDASASMKVTEAPSP